MSASKAKRTKYGKSVSHIKLAVVAQRGQLEHVPPQLNQGDSRGAEDGRGYRH